MLTAAHCLRKRLNVRIGEYDLVEHDGTEMDFQVNFFFFFLFYYYYFLNLSCRANQS